MNKFTKFTAILATGMALSACDIFDFDDDYIGGDFKKLLKTEQEWNDTVKVIDNWGIEDSYSERLFSHKPENFYFSATGSINEIDIEMHIECGDNGGNMTIVCLRNYQNGISQDVTPIIFKNLHGNMMTNKDGYTVRMLDSLKVGKETFRDVFEFDATDADENICNYDKFYINAKKGLLRIDLQDSIVIERMP